MNEILYPEKRLLVREEQILNVFANGHHSSIHKTFKEYNDQKAVYRFLRNDKVSEDYLIQTIQQETQQQSEGKRVLAICDTSSINTQRNKGRISNYDGLGRIGNNQNGKETLGFKLHPILIENELNSSFYGFSAIKMFSRPLYSPVKTKSRRWEDKKKPIEEKSSYRWLGPSLETRDKTLKKAAHITFVMDREGDIIQVLDQLPNHRSDVVIRSKVNRKIITPGGKETRIKDFLKTKKITAKGSIKIRDSKGKVKKIKVSIKYSSVKILGPNTGYKLSAGLDYQVIEVKEYNKKKKPIHWIILTSRKIESLTQALQVIAIYKRRWKIEVFFKRLKSDGYDLEKTALETGKGIRKLTLILMKASLRQEQLKSARNGETDLQTANIFSDLEIRCLNKLNEKLQGNTAKQKNPYPENNLAWASWIIARLGGWTEFYTKARPPGNKTFKEGLDKFDTVMMAYHLFN